MGRLIRDARVILVCLVNPGVAYATTLTIDKALDGVSFYVAVAVFVLSTVMGLTALLNILKDRTPPRLPIFLSAHMLTSWAAGTLAFVSGQYSGIDGWLTVGLIMIASYGGVRSLDLAQARFPGWFATPKTGA